MDDRPIRVQLSRRKGWRMPDNTVKVDRSSYFGNPFAVAPCKTICCGETKHGFIANGYEIRFFESKPEALSFSVDLFRAHIQHPASEKLRAATRTLRGKNLACWCPLDQPCHADVLLEIANG